MMHPKLAALLLFTLVVGLAGEADAQQRRRKATRRAAPAAVKPEGLPSALSVAAGLGYNAPTSDLEGSILPDLEVGYRIGLGEFGVEPALAWQTWSGEAQGRVSSSALDSGGGDFFQEVSADVYELRVRCWYDLADLGAATAMLGIGGVAADATQQSFGTVREEAGGALTWTLRGGYTYPIEEVFGGPFASLGYRSAAVDLTTTGDANLSGFQIFFGWKALFEL